MIIDATGNSECIARLLDGKIRSVRRLIDQHLKSQSPVCNRLINNFQANCGKMIRPKLLLLSGGACGRITDDHILSAAIFEIIHNATLLHDDVIDNGLLRRNKPTINSTWGNKVAILTGDLFLGHAMDMCLGLSNEAMSVIVDAIITTCEGEINQDISGFYDNITEDEYFSIIRMKSAEMFGQCCYLGALLAGANSEICQHLRNYGLLMGTAYQISDDMEDICSDDSELGKSSGRDVQSRVITLPVIYYIQQGGDWRLLNEMQRDEMVEQLVKSNSLEYCQKKIEELCLDAIGQLELLAENEYKYALEEAAKLILSKSAVGQSQPI